MTPWKVLPMSDYLRTRVVYYATVGPTDFGLDDVPRRSVESHEAPIFSLNAAHGSIEVAFAPEIETVFVRSGRYEGTEIQELRRQIEEAAKVRRAARLLLHGTSDKKIAARRRKKLRKLVGK